MTAPAKTRYPRAAAIAVARVLCARLAPVCERLCVAGSLRRQKDLVGDVEIVYLPRFAPAKLDLFFDTAISLADAEIEKMLRDGTLGKRESVIGGTAWGMKNKLAVHAPTGIPVDLFRADAANWWNYLVCRTGSRECNELIATTARARGWKWNPYGPGFTHLTTGAVHPVTSEEEVFAFAGLPYLHPFQR